MTIELGGGRRLMLDNFGRDGGWFWLIAGAIALVVVVLLYRSERQIVSRRTGTTLLVLRVLAALALIVALFDPIAARTRREEVRGRLFIGLDCSASMDTADPSRDPTQDARLGEAIGLSPGEDLSKLPRLEIARRLLGHDLSQRLETDHLVQAFAFARGAVPGRLSDVAAPSPSMDPSFREATDWGPVLESALSATADAAPVVGVVLLSDGVRNAPPARSDDERDRLAERGIPVFPVLMGSTIPPRDVAIVDLKAPDSAYLGDTATVSVDIKADGYLRDEPILVHLKRPDGPELSQTLYSDGQTKAARLTATFQAELAESGVQELTAEVSAATGKEARADNNEVHGSIRVTDDHAKVLIVEGEARWEFRYLRNALMRDERVELESIVLEQPPSSEAAISTYASSLPELPSGPNASDPLNVYDLIIVGDLSPDIVPASFWKRMDAYVAERGGSLIALAGPRSNLGEFSETESLRELLPVLTALVRATEVETSADSPLPGGIRPFPTQAALAEPDHWPMLQLATDGEENREIWASLPALPWIVAGRLKPGATALLQIAGEPESAIVASHPYGLGKVLWIGTDGTWRWRFRVGDQYHHRFWGQIVRWSVEEQLAVGNRLVRFGPDRSRVPEEDGVILRARLSNEVTVDPGGLVAAARIERGGKLVALVPLRPSEDRPRVFEGKAPRLGSGEYLARLDIPGLQSPNGDEQLNQPEASFEVVAAETGERVELAADPTALEDLAKATGGELLIDADATRLPDLLKARIANRELTEETPLWDSPWGLGLFFALLSVEWLIRKRAGLA
jgi:hypothetical protein